MTTADVLLLIDATVARMERAQDSMTRLFYATPRVQFERRERIDALGSKREERITALRNLKRRIEKVP